MTKNRKADLRGIGFDSKTIDYLAGQSEAFSVSDSNTGLEPIASILERMMRPSPKVIRCFRCLACGESYPANRMSSLLILCRICAQDANGKGKIARRNQIERIKNRVGIFLHRRLESI